MAKAGLQESRLRWRINATDCWIAGVSPAEHVTCFFFKAYGLAGCETHPIQKFRQSSSSVSPEVPSG
ncbi:MAG: hypothetical protein RBR69_09480, partial [Candidatus Cloacimonadaceae bacterium]|nr:hypothetical protein [Candidatus Cloacimonadaceae bacterium]